MHKKIKMISSTLLSSILAVTTTFSHLGITYAENIPNQSINILNEKEITKEQSAIKSIILNKNKFSIGENVKIIIEIDKTINNYNSFILNYINEKGKQINLYANINLENGKYESNLMIDDSFEESIWRLNSIAGINNDISTEYIDTSNLDINLYNFEVVKKEDVNEYSMKKESTKSIDKPTIESMSVDKKTAKHGDEVNIELKFKEGYLGDDYRISSGYGRYVEENWHYGLGLNFYYNFIKEVYEGSLTISDNMPPGEYEISGINIYSEDYTEPPIYIGNDEYDFSRYSINLDTLWDTEEPTLESIIIDKNEATIGDKIKFSINAKDNLSIVDLGQITLIDEKNTTHIVRLEYNEETKQLDGYLDITNRIASGKLNIDSVYLRDHSWNSSYYDSNTYDFSKYYVNIYGTAGDSKGPEINSIYVDKKEAQPGEKVKIEIEAEDESGISYISVDFKDKSNKYFGITLNFNSETGKYEGELNINHSMKNGILSIESIYAYDIYYNNTYIRSYNNDLSEYDILISNSIEDEEGPELNSISVDKNNATLGDKVTFSIDASDNKSEVSGVEISLNYPGMDESSARVYYAEYNNNTKKWESTIDITNNIPEGIIKVYNLRLADTNGNISYYDKDNYNFSKCNVEVNGTLGDIKGPELVSIDIDKKEAQPGEKVKIEIEAEDESGISYISVDFKDKSNKYFGITLNFNSETGKYEGELNINHSMKNGILSIKSIDAYDIYYNNTFISSYDNDLSEYDILISNSIEDEEGPELVSIDIDKKEAGHGETVKISIEAKDDKSQVSSVSLGYGPKKSNENGYIDYERHITCYYNPDTNKWEGSMDINNRMQSGLWEVKAVWLRDECYNSTSIWKDNYDFSDLDITLNTIEDNKAPELKSISVDKNNINKSGTVKITADIYDESDVEYASLRYINTNRENDYDYEYVSLNYNSETKLYEGYIYFDEWYNSGIYAIEYINLSDSLYNSSTIYNYDYDFSNCTIELTGTIGRDNKAPEIKSVQLDKYNVTKNETIKVSIDAIDDKSGVRAVIAKFINSDSTEYKIVNCKYNSNTSKYEGNLDITDEDTSGKWTLEYVYAEDNRWYSICEDKFKVNIDIYGTVGKDDKAPMLDDIVVENNAIKLKVSDDKSGVKKVDVRYYNKELNKYTWINCNYNSNTHMFEGYLNTSDDMSGEWKITSVYLQDNSYNWDYIYSDEYDFSNCNITMPSLINEAIVEEIKQEDIVEQTIEETPQSEENQPIMQELSQSEENELVIEEIIIEQESISNIGEMSYE